MSEIEIRLLQLHMKLATERDQLVLEPGVIVDRIFLFDFELHLLEFRL